MSNIEGLKEQARRHEQKEEWRKALDLYQRAITRLDEEDAPDIGLYNRVGDLFIRVGEVDQAVRALEQAVELYVDSELPNNAIAVCKKILRNVPDRYAVFLRMGEIRADQGFLVDARTHFLTYAERAQAAGELDEALRAMVEFADAAPDDTEIRLAVAGHFQQHDRVAEAVEQLVQGYRSARRQELDDVVAVFVERLAELRPGEDPDDIALESDGGDALDALDPGGLDELHPFEQDGPFAGAPDDGGEDDAAWDYGDTQPLDESAVEAESAEDVAAAESDEGSMERADALEEATWEPRPVADEEEAWGEIVDVADDAVDEAHDRLGAAMDDAISSIGPDVSGFVRSVDESNPLEGFDVLDDADGALDDTDDEDEPLPLTVFHDGDDAGEVEILDDADPWSDDDDDDGDLELPLLHVPEPDDGEAPVQEVDDVEMDVQGDDPWAEAVEDARSEVGLVSDEASDAPSEAEALAARIAAAPDDLDLRQRAVEMAHRSGDEQSLVEAYVGLGEALRRSGSEARAQAVLREALQLDPDHPAARAALSGAPDAAREVSEVASNEDYVDLGALILGEDEEKTTRFVVAYEEPSGDEQADFAKMLTQFKAKVAENVDASDVKAHHDLGTAYKEMGLLDEAVEEFQAALRASADHLPTYEMLGQTFLEKGTPETAVRVLSRALEVPFEVEDELLGIYYCLGRSHQDIGNTDEALEFYERIFSLDINFADVTERLRALR